MFENENTLGKLRAQGRESYFHESYEKAVEQVRKGKLGKNYPMIIGGKDAFSKEGTFVDKSPSDTDLVVGYFQKGTRQDAKEAIRAAKDEFEEWSSTPYQDRVKIFRRAADIVSERKFELAAEMTFENGKNRYEAVADIDEAIDFLRYYSEELEQNKGFDRVMRGVVPAEHARSILRPYGVWAVISPFNFPLAIATGMSTGACITGNTVVLKPASDTPLMSYELARLVHRAGVPGGAFNYVTGPGSTVGSELTENEDVEGVAFTGSWDIGAHSFVEFQKGRPRPFIAEMGGKNATIVTKNADLEKAAEGVIKAAFGYGGQKCSACSRVYVQNSVKDEFVKRLVEKASALKVGDPAEKETFLGPLINQSAYTNFARYAEEARNSGGRVAFGGGVLKEGKYAKGYFVEPTILVDAPAGCKLLKTELFVPILAVEAFGDLEGAINELNDVVYGLTAGIFSADKNEVDTFFTKAKAGVLYANKVSGSTTGAMVGAQPFVGWKKSGSSGKGAGGPYYLQQFLREQSQTFYT
ncbi:MAG TPA: aldehyde dehydrogenase family protein [Nitrososphaerales archaeon]|nr:aldehyde dehydrogenase family protein [Nitrososphaerales archaeon]